jgi:tetratricopeptide (TPR) repeat protein
LEQLRIAAPEVAKVFELDEATLTIASGMIEAGLSNLKHMIDTSPDNIYIRAALAAELISLGRYHEAEATLQAALALQDTLPVDRAEIYGLLFHLYRRTPDIDRAESAWVESCALDPTRTERRSEVIRMFIYWQYFERAINCIRQETNIGRQYFYSGLCEFHIGRAPTAIKAWSRLADWRVEEVSDSPDEYAETCLYLNRPRNAIAVLRPLIDAGQINVWRLFLLGLAYALMIDLARAKHFLDISLRLADAARPRESRSGTGSQIIHGGSARETYGRMITATDLRAELDAFFIPLPTNAGQEIIS